MNIAAVFTGALASDLAFELGTASGSEVSGSWSVCEPLHQPTGILHGGIHCLIVEGMASWGGALWYGDRGVVVGVSNSTDFYRAVEGGRLRSVAKPVHQGRTSQVWGVETTDEHGRLIAQGKVRLQNLPAE